MKYFVHFANDNTWDRKCGKLYSIHNSNIGDYMVDDQGDTMRVVNDSSLFQHGDYMYVEFIP